MRTWPFKGAIILRNWGCHVLIRDAIFGGANALKFLVLEATPDQRTLDTHATAAKKDSNLRHGKCVVEIGRSQASPGFTPPWQHGPRISANANANVSFRTVHKPRSSHKDMKNKTVCHASKKSPPLQVWTCIPSNSKWSEQV